MVKFVPSQPMGVKEHFAFINWVPISLNLGSHSGGKKMLVITDWLFIQSLGPC
jgi:hypothetical protein